MIAYEFYCPDEKNGDHLIGILPERRKDSARITEESVMQWVRKVLGDSTDINRIIFIKVTLDERDD